MPAKLLYGSNIYSALEHYDEIISDFERANGRESIHLFDGEKATADEVALATSSQSLFGGENELIVIRRIGSNNDLRDSLLQIIDSLSDTTQLVVFDPGIDKRSKLFKTFKKSYETIEFTILTDVELNNWITQRIENKGGVIQPGAARILSERSKGDQLRISNEIDKLLNYDKNITQDTVRILIDESPDDNVFELLNFVASNDKEKAQTKLNELLRAQIEPHYILVMIAWQISNMLAVKSASGVSDSDIASKLGMNPYSVSRTKASARNISKEKLQSMAEKVIAADIKTKTTSVDVVQIIRQLISKL